MYGMAKGKPGMGRGQSAKPGMGKPGMAKPGRGQAAKAAAKKMAKPMKRGM